MACEQNLLDVPLSAVYPNDTDVILVTREDGTSVLTRWSVLKPKPRWSIVDIPEGGVAAGEHIEMPGLNGVVFDRIENIIRTERSCRNIVNSAPSGPDIQFVPSSGSDNAYIVLSDAAFYGEWIKVIFL